MPGAVENKVLMIVLAILIPPLAVGLKEGIGTHFVINLVLLLLTFGVGALIHALWIVLR
ncbi:MAG: YqaE/Pmp3 family membrane protein [Phycisphaerales bacterium]